MSIILPCCSSFVTCGLMEEQFSGLNQWGTQKKAHGVLVSPKVKFENPIEEELWEEYFDDTTTDYPGTVKKETNEMEVDIKPFATVLVSPVEDNEIIEETKVCHQLDPLEGQPFLIKTGETKTLDISLKNSSESQIGSSDKPFKCDMCTKTFASKQGLNQHKTVYCGQNPRKSSLNIHKTSRSGGRAYKCDMCSVAFKVLKNLCFHRQMHSMKESPKKNPLEKHQRVDADEKTIKCDECPRIFKSCKELKTHRNSHTNQFKCKTCHGMFRQKAALVRHERTHTVPRTALGREYKCVDCAVAYPSKMAFLAHMKTHGSHMNHSCEMCSKSFLSASHLKSHQNQVHTIQEPFECEFCSQRYKTKLLLTRHKCDENKNLFDCDVGSVFCALTNDLQNDKYPHSDEKSFVGHNNSQTFESDSRISNSNLLTGNYVKCNICSEVFNTTNQLKVHKKSHAGGTFSCEICSESFGKSYELILHKRNHVVEKPFQCDKCFESFALASTLKVHQRIHLISALDVLF